MKKKKRLFAFILTGAMVIATVAGCGSSSETNANGDAEEQTTSITAPQAYPLPEGEESSTSLGVFEYDQTYYVTLTADDDADIYYEVAEGEDAAETPTTDSQKFEYEQYQLIMLTQPEASSEGDVEQVYNIKAIAVKDGETSDVANWNYTVTSHPHHDLKVSAPVDSEGNEVADVTLIQDYDNDKMYLLEGSERAMVIDAGYFDAEDQGNLYETAREIVGEDKPIDLVIAHPHPDHVQMTHQFLCEENKALGGAVYVNERGIEVLREYVLQFGVASGMFSSEDEASEAYDAQLKTLSNGDVLDLGDKQYDIIELPGHQVAGIMLYDQQTGYLFTTDQIGNNRAHRADSFWMQFGDMAPTFFADPMDVYQASLAVALERLDTLGEIKVIMSGHNDVALLGTEYIDNLKQAVQQVIDNGAEGLHTPLNSLDNLKENTMTSVVGERLEDVNWAAVNVNLENYLSDGYRDGNQNKLADLCNLSVHLPGEKGNLLWEDAAFGINVNWDYPSDGTKPVRKETSDFTAQVPSGTEEIELVPTACASDATIQVNSQPVNSGEAITIALDEADTVISIVATAPDGESTHEYTVTVTTK